MSKDKKFIHVNLKCITYIKNYRQEKICNGSAIIICGNLNECYDAYSFKWFSSFFEVRDCFCQILLVLIFFLGGGIKHHFFFCKFTFAIIIFRNSKCKQLEDITHIYHKYLHLYICFHMWTNGIAKTFTTVNFLMTHALTACIIVTFNHAYCNNSELFAFFKRKYK